MNTSKILGAVTCGALVATLAASAREAITPDEIINSFEDTPLHAAAVVGR